MLPVAVAAMPTVPVAEPEPRQSYRHSQAQAEEADARSGGGCENTNWAWVFGGAASPQGAPATKHKPVMGATAVFAWLCVFAFSVTV